MTKKTFFDILCVVVGILLIFTTLSLISYNGDDPSYSTVVFIKAGSHISNIFGKAGAYYADMLGIVLGWGALFIPFFLSAIIYFCVQLNKGSITKGRLVGALFSCILFIISVSAMSGLIGGEDLFFKDKLKGGLAGYAIAGVLVDTLSKSGGMIAAALAIIISIFGIFKVSLANLLKPSTTTTPQQEATKESPKDKDKIVIRTIDKQMDKPAAAKPAPEAAPVEQKKGFFASKMAAYKEGRAVKKAEKAEQKAFEANRKQLLKEASLREAQMQESSAKSLNMELKPVDGRLTDDELSAIQGVLDGVDSRPEFLNPVSEELTLADIDLKDTDMIISVSKLEEILQMQDSLAANVDDEKLFKPVEFSAVESYDNSQPEPLEPANEEFTPINPAQLPVVEREAIKIVKGYETDKHIHKGKNEVTGKDYHLSFDLLDRNSEDTPVQDHEELQEKADLLMARLIDFGVDGRIREIQPGPVVTLFEFEPAPGVKINKIANLESDLALAMSAISIRIIAPIPGKSVVGIEIPNRERAMVGLRELLETEQFKTAKSPLICALGKDIAGAPYFSDISKMPHLLVAGTTGSGKSVCINTIICSILFKTSPEFVKFIMIDPKMVELSVYEGIPHLAAPVVTDARKANLVLQNVVKVMESRYSMMAHCRVRNIDSYNSFVEKNPDYLDEAGEPIKPMPYMVIIVDEFADLMLVAGKEVENSIIRIAQMARAVGMHLILATQRPSVNVITGIIKANMPARLSFRVSSKIDSRTVIDQNGAELLLGKGDSLFVPPGSSEPVRIHGCFVSEAEVLRIVDAVRLFGEPDYDMGLFADKTASDTDFDDDDIDERYAEAVEIVKERGSASISMIQRYLRIGYNRAARIVETMERQGLIAPSDGTSKPREYIGED